MWPMILSGTGASAAWSPHSPVWHDSCGSAWHGSLVLLVGTCPKTIIPWPKRCQCWSCVEPCSTETGTHWALVPSACAPHKHPGNPADHWHFSASFSLQLVSGWLLISCHSLMGWGAGTRIRVDTRRCLAARACEAFDSMSCSTACRRWGGWDGRWVRCLSVEGLPGGEGQLGSDTRGSLTPQC